MCQRQHLGSVSVEQFKTLQLSIVQIGLLVSAGKSALRGKVDLPANSTFFTMIRFLVHTGKMFTDGTDISRHVFFTLTKLGTDFANLGK